MDIANRFDAGGAIATLRQARNDVANTNFNEMIDEINTKTSDDETLFGTIQKTGASVTAVGAIGKGVVSNLSKLKSKITGKDSDGAETGSGEEIELQRFEGPSRQPSEVQGAEEDTTADTTADTSVEEPGLFDRGPNPFRGEEDEEVEGFEETDPIEENAVADDEPLFSAEITGEEGGEYTGVVGQSGATSFTQGTTGGLLQRTDATTSTTEEGGDIAEEGVDLSAEATADAAESGASTIGNAISNIVSSATNALGNIGNTASQVVSGVSSAVDAATSATSGAIDATTGGLATGGEVALEAAGSAGLEAAGSALDATGVGAPIGLILNILGGLVLGGTMTAGIVGEVDSSNEQADATSQAQEQLKSATSGAVAGIAGRYAV